MALNPTLIKSLRKLLRFGASARAARILHKLTTEEIAGVLPALTLSERAQSLDLLLSTPESGEKFCALPPEFPALDQGLAALPDTRLAAYCTLQSPIVSAAVLRHLPSHRRVELRCSFEPELARSIERYLCGPHERRERRQVKRERSRREEGTHPERHEVPDRRTHSIRERLSSLISYMF